jgi:beta-N-acetylhexosaminidase
MESTRPPKSNGKLQSEDDGEEVTQKLFIVQSSKKSGNLEQKPVDSTATTTNNSSNDSSEVGSNSQNGSFEAAIDSLEPVRTPTMVLQEAIGQELQKQDHTSPPSIEVADREHEKATKKAEDTPLERSVTFKFPAQTETGIKQETPTIPLKTKQRPAITRGKAILYASFLLIIVLNAAYAGYAQFIGPQGWAFVIGGPANTDNGNPLAILKNELHHKLTPGATTQATPQLTPQQYINLIVQNMTLDQKLGQMMIVQFVGPTYSLDISTMISQYHVGAALLFTANNNIVNKVQLKGLIQQMQSNSSSSSIPMIVAIDQEGGTVDRLKMLDGPRTAAADIGATNDPGKAMAAGIQDAQDLASYGFNLNLAPVVDVTNVYNPQLYDRTYGNNAALVTKMAQAYLQGLQQSGKVSGTLKHFPGLGDVGVDPHLGVPDLYRSKSDLQAIDWAPYRALIQQGNVRAIMVTHEIVHAIDSSIPSSLSYKVVTGILRNELGFQGVIMTDSLTMEGITAYYTEAQAAALAVEAGSDLLMGATTSADVASMIQGIKQAIDSGEISQQRIDDSVRRILMLKYHMGLLPLPKN